MKLKFKPEIPNFKRQLVTLLAYVTRMKLADQKIFAGIRENLEWPHQLTSSVNEKYFKMIKDKACVQLKRSLDDWCVMVYKTLPSYHHVFTEFLHKINQLRMH